MQVTRKLPEKALQSVVIKLFPLIFWLLFTDCVCLFSIGRNLRSGQDPSRSRRFRSRSRRRQEKVQNQVFNSKTFLTLIYNWLFLTKSYFILIHIAGFNFSSISTLPLARLQHMRQCQVKVSNSFLSIDALIQMNGTQTAGVRTHIFCHEPSTWQLNNWVFFFYNVINY